MEILLVRHATAEGAKSGQDDSDRELTSRGITQFQKVVSGMDRLGMRLDKVIHSPWARAAQTAELLAPIHSGTCLATPLLAGEPNDRLLGLLAEQPQSHRLALVGHQPWLSDLLAVLCFGSTGHGHNIRFKKGGVASLEGEPIPAGMDLIGLYTPRCLRRLG